MSKQMQDKLSRMKAMMTYGLQTENKDCQYCSIEQTKVAADGKMYGVVREGTKYYIKVSEKTQNPLKEDFDYIGGFRNRKNHEYNSCAKAMKQLEMKLMSINEAYDKHKGIMIESWNLDKKEGLTQEATERMKQEIARQREIMSNAKQIFENKGSYCKVTGDCGASQNNNIKKTSDGKGEPTGNGGDPFTEKVDAEQSGTQKTNVKKEFKPVMNEGEQVLGWNNNADYMDKSHGTEIGDSAPFDKPLNSNGQEADNGVVEECEGVLHNSDNQNCPKPGVSEVGDDAPFDEKAKNNMQESSLFNFDEPADEVIIDETDFDDGFEDDAVGDDAELNDFEDAEEVGDKIEALDDAEGKLDDDVESLEGAEDSIENRLKAIEDALKVLTAKIEGTESKEEFEDDDLYPSDEDDNIEGAEDVDFESESDEDDTFTEGKVMDKVKGAVKDGFNKVKDAAHKTGEWLKKQDEIAQNAKNPYYEESKENVRVFESKAYKQMMSEEGTRLNDFGKHPAYQKEVMTLPPNQYTHNNGYYDMNDESVANEKPYGQQIGSGAPFEDDPEDIENAIAESIQRMFNARKNR